MRLSVRMALTPTWCPRVAYILVVLFYLAAAVTLPAIYVVVRPLRRLLFVRVIVGVLCHVFVVVTAHSWYSKAVELAPPARPRCKTGRGWGHGWLSCRG